MEKVKVSREAAEALELMKAKGAPLNEIVERHVCSDLIIVNGWENVRLLPTDTLIRALYIGYEVEQTPEDKVREFYNTFMQPVASQDLYKGELVARAIRDTLDYLNIQIEGVNT